MCILFIRTDPKPKPGGYRLIVATNRDEYYTRPAKKAQLYPETKTIAGMDMEAGREGGMWFGVTLKETNDGLKFRLGAILNVTGEKIKKGTQGRGFIIPNYLKSESSEAYLIEMNETGPKYNPYNFVTVELSQDNTITNCQSNSPTSSIPYNGLQVLGFGNSTPAAPLKKVKEGCDRFQQITETYGTTSNSNKLTEELLQLLKWDQRHLPDPELESRAPNTYEYLSSVYVRLEDAGYGTRTHTIVLVDDEWNVKFLEWTMEEPINPHQPKWNQEQIMCRL